MAIVLIATEWGSANGGVNAFNQGLSTGLAAVQGEPVFCAVTRADADAHGAAEKVGVRLIPVAGEVPDDWAAPECGDEVMFWLAAHFPGTAVSVWVGHDLISGSAAAAAAQSHGGIAALIHHMDYLSYGNLPGNEGAKTEAKHRAQIKLFTSAGAVVFGVGPWLTQSAGELAKGSAQMLVPGFPTEEPNAGREDRLRVILAGRFERKNEPLKRALLAAEAFGVAVRDGADYVSALEDPTMVVLGVDDAQSKALEDVAQRRAGRHVNVVPAPFNPDPRSVVDHLVRSNLAIMPSAHEGFGLIGWEAIGAGVPLILGTGSGLLRGLDQLSGVSAESCVFPVRIDGRAGEVEEMARAIVKVAKDLPKARAKAADLRAMLKAQHGCTWKNTAEHFLRGVRGVETDRHVGAVAAPVGGAASTTTWIAPPPQNHFPLCTELSLSVGQGSSGQSFNLVAELRFGIQELAHEGIEAQISISGVTVRVTSRHGRIIGERLGDRSTPGIEAWAGGIWILTPTDGGSRMPNKALGSETLCRIATPAGAPGHAQVEVTTAKRDIQCSIRSKYCDLSRTTEKVMGVFLKEAILKQESGHVVLNVAEVMEASDG